MENKVQVLLDKYLEEGKIVSICQYEDKSITFTTKNDDVEWTFVKIPYIINDSDCLCHLQKEKTDIYYQIFNHNSNPVLILCIDCLYKHLVENWECFEERYI